MADAVLWQLLDHCQEVLRDTRFEPQGTDSVSAIKDNNIYFKKSSVQQPDDEKQFTHDGTPGIIITVPKTVTSQSSAGDNTRDRIEYPILFQIIDQDYREPVKNLRTYLKWQEQIVRLFHNQPISDPCEVYGTEAAMVDVVDEKIWSVHDMFVAGVEIRFLSLETRGA
jgi:hypothetical protein